MITILTLLLSTTFLVPQKEFKENVYTPKVEELRDSYGNNKKFLEDLELASLIALSFYPELENTYIQFKRSNTKTTMETRPVIGSLFKRKINRKYTIHVDNKLLDNNGILVDSIPFNALVGLIGHEYAHVVQYEGMNIYEFGRLGSRYSKESFKIKFKLFSPPKK